MTSKATPQVLLALAALMALVAAACGSSTDVSQESPDPIELADTSTETATTATSSTDTAGEDTAPEPVADVDDDVDDDDHDDEDHEHGDGDADHDHDDDVTVAVSTDVSGIDFLGSYQLVDETFGTSVSVTVDGTTRTIESNSLPNHEVGQFPNPGNPNTITEQALSYEFPVEPTFTGQATFAQTAGVALTGVPFEPGTGESAICATGENYRIEGLQEMFDLGMDVNNAHVQPTGKYHYHGASTLLVDAISDDDEDLVLVGFAGDGHLMYYSLSTAYDSSYSLSTELRSGTDCEYRGTAVEIDGTTPDGTYVSDWVWTEGLGDLDECNGAVINGSYAYIVSEQYPFVPRCLMGEAAGGGPGGGQGGAGQGGAGGGGQGGGPAGPPDLVAVAATLGVTVEELEDALGDPPPDLDAAAATLGITADALQEALGVAGGAPSGG